MKIRTRLTLYFTFLVMAIVLAGSAVTYLSVYQYNEKVFYERLYGKAITTAQRRLEMEEVDSALLARIDKYQRDILVDENITVYDSTDHDIYTNNDTIYYKEYKALFDNIRAKKYIHYTEGRYKIIAFTYNVNGNHFIISAGAIDKRGNEILRQLGITLTLILITSGILALFIGWFFVGKSLSPISAITDKVNTISPIEHSERLSPLTEKDEIAELIVTFNRLFDKLEDAFSQQKSFMANISHELNNPLAKIKSQIEVGLMHDRSTEFYKKNLESVLEDVDDLTELIQGLMKFSKLAYGPYMARTALRIDELLFDIRDTILAEHPDYNISINLPFMPTDNNQLLVQANRQLLITAIKNIADNACKFSTDKSAVISLLFDNKAVLISIADNGPGISPTELPRIFDIFYRSPGLQSVKGYGIGLSLSHKILKAHQFDIEVVSEVGMGTIFTIKIKP